MQIDLSNKEIRIIKNSLIALEYAKTVLNLGDSKELMNLYKKFEAVCEPERQHK